MNSFNTDTPTDLNGRPTMYTTCCEPCFATVTTQYQDSSGECVANCTAQGGVFHMLKSILSQRICGPCPDGVECGEVNTSKCIHNRPLEECSICKDGDGFSCKSLPFVGDNDEIETGGRTPTEEPSDSDMSTLEGTGIDQDMYKYYRAICAGKQLDDSLLNVCQMDFGCCNRFHTQHRVWKH